MRGSPGSEQARIAPQISICAPKEDFTRCAPNITITFSCVKLLVSMMPSTEARCHPCSGKVFVKPYIGVSTGARPSSLLLDQGCWPRLTYKPSHLSGPPDLGLPGPLAGSPEPLSPLFAPAGLSGVADLFFRHIAGGHGTFVAVQVAEARVAQDIGRFPGG
jgi:hypothetical protein